MADELVLRTQKWLNKTYLKVSGYEKVPEDGHTGWATIYGLIEGLQHELGISPVVPNFGAGTKAAYETQITGKWGSDLSHNVVYLIQGAFWCKGIDPGGFDGIYSKILDSAVKKLKTYGGFTNPDGILSALWAKALFDMSAFTLLSTGNARVQAMQRWLNANYYDYTGIMPCDGIYQRGTNEALIYSLQAEEGLSPEEATGTYGNLTTQLTPTLVEGENGQFVSILKFGLLVNGFYEIDDFGPLFSNYVGNKVKEFREFMILAPYNEIADVTVIKGLLSSAGHTERPADGADTSTQLTYTQIQTLLSNGLKFIGRYLTGTVGTGSEERDKFLTKNECEMLFDAGINIFPIYQDGGSYIEYFNRIYGYQDGENAGKAAIKLGIPRNVTIYFAVDLDILGDDIEGTVIEYFTGISQSLLEYGYTIGIYGTRNVCSKIINAGLAKYAFVADMSTGFSGNLGFPMPRQWTFDQFIEFAIGSGEGTVGIDNVAVSYKDQGFTHLEDNENGSDLFLTFVEKVQALAKEYFPVASELGRGKQVADYFRNVVYGNPIWEVIAGPIDWKFIEFVDDKIPKDDRIYTYIDPVTHISIGAEHFFAAISGYLFSGLPDPNEANLGDGCGWLGDLDTLLIDYVDNKNDITSIYNFGFDWIGGVGDAGVGHFNQNDLIADIDAWNISYLLTHNSGTLSEWIHEYFQNKELQRYATFVTTRYAAVKENILSCAQIALMSDSIEHPILSTFRKGLLIYFGGVEYLDVDKESKVKYDLCVAFQDKLFKLAQDEIDSKKFN
ncbi:hypothetical protein RV11_GL003143 [Enterococcus phoeniculicola]|uniref:Rv2525c-like glycoside hydrolase-like domain-containing protein n=1 Tax=Enterococcus phoeniculicola ATCC BAA-412 TaxID=1158610 RepID=R3W5W0_9ENTE|nr:glycoside hydrolase domain-containing protein [Enterococcus phoeniculicola]EOL43041.1 hypothetical protein UC3_02018 [Enterococcus phoeniculicola ATCC BAA-412]EOT76601.1 hypothetical protein I589_01558 [Enterococcus phoeniculicola ATCC BAA-412]OJG72172.1 hypothetical protein RV11_GL003143 [Enterococcus phoeniculicola]